MAKKRSTVRITTRPVLAWVPVVDAQGRTHMEMRWQVASPRPAHTRRAHRAA